MRLNHFYVRDDVNMFVAQNGLYIMDDALLVKHSRPIDYFQSSFENPRIHNLQQSNGLLLMKSKENDTLYSMRFSETEKQTVSTSRSLQDSDRAHRD